MTTSGKLTSGTKLYNAQYGSTTHDPRPQFVVRGNRVYATAKNPLGPSNLPLFKIQGDKLIPTENHPSAAGSTHPWYEIRGTNVHTTEHNPDHSQIPTFVIKGK